MILRAEDDRIAERGVRWHVAAGGPEVWRLRLRRWRGYAAAWPWELSLGRYR